MSKTVDLIPIEQVLQEYDKLRSEKSKLESRLKTLSEDIKSYAEQHGSKNDVGSFYGETDAFIYGKQAKKSISFNVDKTLDFLKQHELSKAIVTVETLDEKAIEQYVADGRISISDLEDITNTKVIYAVDVKKKEEMPVVESVTVPAPVAASRKPRLL